jgi:hypothetical protein
MVESSIINSDLAIVALILYALGLAAVCTFGLFCYVLGARPEGFWKGIWIAILIAFYPITSLVGWVRILWLHFVRKRSIRSIFGLEEKI